VVVNFTGVRMENKEIKKILDKEIEHFSIPKDNMIGHAMVYYLKDLKAKLLNKSKSSASEMEKR